MTTPKERFSKAIDGQFKLLGVNASYVHPPLDDVPIKVIPRRPDQLYELGESRMHAENPQFEFRLSEVASPSWGDEIHIEGRIYRIEEEPRKDMHHLVWQVDTLRVRP